jgi:hypothetical protein
VEVVGTFCWFDSVGISLGWFNGVGATVGATVGGFAAGGFAGNTNEGNGFDAAGDKIGVWAVSSSSYSRIYYSLTCILSLLFRIITWIS